jgi:TolB-like protein
MFSMGHKIDRLRSASNELDAFGPPDYRWTMVRFGFVAFLLMSGLLAGDGWAVAAPSAGHTALPTTLAVLYFDYGGSDASLEALRKGLAQMLISDLSAVDDLRVVERERLQAILDEQKLAQTGKTDAATAARIGKLLGARYLVLGSYFDVMKALRVDARLVDVETGQIVKSVGAAGKADDFLDLEQKLADGLEQALRGVASGPSRSEAPTRQSSPKPPRQLKTGTAIIYGRALVAMDDGDRKTARTLFKKVLSAQPDFELAQRDLNRLVQ